LLINPIRFRRILRVKIETMSITKKTILIIMSVMIPLFVIIYVTSDVFINRGFEQIEKNKVEENLLRAQDAISTKLRNLELFSYDWSNWDDTYEFVQDHNNDYVEANLLGDTFKTSEINMMIFVDTHGRVVYSKAYDLQNSSEMPVPDIWISELTQGILLKESSENPTTSGIIVLSGQPMLVVLSPIVTSKGEGPSKGIYIISQNIDASFLKSISEVTHLSLNMQMCNQDSISDDFKIAQEKLSQSKSSYIQPVDERTISGYSYIYDIYGSPAFILKVDMLRDIYTQSVTTVGYLHAALLLIAMVFIVLFIFILRKNILNRVINLEKAVLDIGKTGDNKNRVKVSGKDELSSLADNINKMLISLEKAEEQIKILYENEKRHGKELEEEGKARAQFINILAHELRTPMTPILISAEMIRDELASKPDSLQYKMISNVLKSAEILRRRLEELLDLARFARGAFKLNLCSIEIEAYLKSIVNRYEPALDQKHQNLSLDISPGLSKIEADPSRLEQVILNLLSNASKYSPESSTISFKASLERNDLRIEIKDQGIGIPGEELKKLFTPYHRVEQDKKEFAGTGLGLAVSAQIVQAHGGKIWVESERGKGSTFIFALPVDGKTDKQGERIVDCRTFSEIVSTAEVDL
jgi:signal transduction histidine kinase